MKRFSKSDISKVADYVRANYDGELDIEVEYTENYMEHWRCPLGMANMQLMNDISSLAENYCEDNDIDKDSMWEEIDETDIFYEL